MDKLVNSTTGIPALLGLKLNLCPFYKRASFSLNSYSVTRIYNRGDIGYWKWVLCWVNLKQFQLTFMSAAPVLAQGIEAGIEPSSLIEWAPWGDVIYPKVCWAERGGMACESISTGTLHPPTKRTKEPMVCSVFWSNFCSAINVSPWAFSHIIFQTGFLASVLIFANAPLLLFMDSGNLGVILTSFFFLLCSSPLCFLPAKSLSIDQCSLLLLFHRVAMNYA